MSNIIQPYRYVATSANPVVNSLNFVAASLQSVSQTNANWGSYDRAKFAIMGSFRISDLSVTRNITSKMTGSGASQEYRLEANSSGQLRFVGREASLNTSEFVSATSAIAINTWYSFLIHYDSANAVSADRIKMWINNAAVTASSYTAPAAALQTTTTQVSVGQWDSGNYMDGLIYSIAFVSGQLPTAANVFNGSAGKLKDLSGLTGLKSLLTGATAVKDYLLTDWTNNNAVTTSGTMP